MTRGIFFQATADGSEQERKDSVTQEDTTREGSTLTHRKNAVNPEETEDKEYTAITLQDEIVEMVGNGEVSDTSNKLFIWFCIKYIVNSIPHPGSNSGFWFEQI